MVLESCTRPSISSARPSCQLMAGQRAAPVRASQRTMVDRCEATASAAASSPAGILASTSQRLSYCEV